MTSLVIWVGLWPLPGAVCSRASEVASDSLGEASIRHFAATTKSQERRALRRGAGCLFRVLTTPGPGREAIGRKP